MSEQYDENVIQIKRMSLDELLLALKEYDENFDKRFSGPFHPLDYGPCSSSCKYCEIEQGIRNNNYEPTPAFLELYKTRHTANAALQQAG